MFSYLLEAIQSQKPERKGRITLNPPQGAAPTPGPGGLSRCMGAGRGCRAALPVLSVQVHKPGNSSAEISTSPLPHPLLPCSMSQSSGLLFINPKALDRKQKDLFLFFQIKGEFGNLDIISAFNQTLDSFFLPHHPLEFGTALNLSKYWKEGQPPCKTSPRIS